MRLSRPELNCALSHAQMTAAKFAERESATEARLTIPLQSSMAVKTERTTCAISARPVTATKPAKMLVRRLPTLKPKSTWPRLAEEVGDFGNQKSRMKNASNPNGGSTKLDA